MTKRKLLVLVMALAAVWLLAGFAVAAETDPIVTTIEISPSKLTGPGPVSVTITISNAGDTDLKDPVVLYDPAAKIVSDFGTNGAALLKAGESKTWTGTYDVNQRTLDNGAVVFYVKYKLYKESGEAVDQSQPIRAQIGLQTAETDIEVKRTITPTIAREGQSVVVRYDIINSGTVSLLNITLTENKDVYNGKQTISIPELKPGANAEIKFPVTMGKKDLTSSAKITYISETQKKKQTYTVEKQTIKYGESSLDARLSASAKGVVENGTITLTLTLKNTGNMDYSDIRVTDAALGDVFTNQELKAGNTLTLEKEVTIPASMDFQFNVTATDTAGTEMSVATDPVTITAVDPSQALHLTVTATADRTEVFEQPGQVRFTIQIANDSTVEAKEVAISHGDTTLYTFDTIPAGESRSLSRDTALSMAGKYRFTVTAKDSLDSETTFQSNEIQIAFSVPTPAPATPTPAPEPTAEPTFSPATFPPLSDASIAPVAKTIHAILIPVSVLAGLLLIACCVLLVVASKRRADQRKASESAIDQLERAKRRDYVQPAEEEEPEETPEVRQETEELSFPQEEEDYELPHLKYARKAASSVEDNGYSAMNSGFYDDEEELLPKVERPAPDELLDDLSWEGESAPDADETYDEYQEAEQPEWDYDQDAYEEDGSYADEAYEETAYEDEPQPEEEPPTQDDSAFRRPVEEEGRSRRRSRSSHE